MMRAPVTIVLCLIVACSIAGDSNGAIATTLTVINGSSQTGKVGAQLAVPLLVQVKDQNGLPAIAVPVTFAATAGATVGHVTVLSDAAGNAATRLNLGQVPGTGTATASAAGVGTTVTFTFTATSGDPAAIAVVSGNNQTKSAGSVLDSALVVRVTDRFGNAVAGVAVDWTTNSGTFTSPVQTTSAADGKASVTFTLSTTPGVATPTATVRGTTSKAAFTEVGIAPPPT